MCTMIPGLDLLAFDCPQCAFDIRVPAAFAGRRGACPSCQQPIRIPEPPPATIPGDELLLDDDDDDEVWGMDSGTGPLPVDAHALIPRARPSMRAESKDSEQSEPNAEAILEQLPAGQIELVHTPWPRAAVFAVAVLTTLALAAVTLGTLAIVA